jgi:hypothetical protein
LADRADAAGRADADADHDKARRAAEAMMKMIKLDIAALEGSRGGHHRLKGRRP